MVFFDYIIGIVTLLKLYIIETLSLFSCKASDTE